jgi:hypothetical protein
VREERESLRQTLQILCIRAQSESGALFVLFGLDFGVSLFLSIIVILIVSYWRFGMLVLIVV